MHLMYYAGADSVDSAGWRVKAAYGAIQLPGVGDRYITNRTRNKKYKDLTEEDTVLLNQCKCPICKNEDPQNLRTSYTKRALHNAYVYQKEVEKARRLTRKNRYNEYVHGILERNRLFSKVLWYYDNILTN